MLAGPAITAFTVSHPGYSVYATDGEDNRLVRVGLGPGQQQAETVQHQYSRPDLMGWAGATALILLHNQALIGQC